MVDYSGQKVLVVGNGISGSGAYMSLYSLGVAVDTLSHMDDELDYSDYISNYDTIVISPSISINSYFCRTAISQGKNLIGELELGFTLFGGVVVAVTGTNGKTTTTRLIGEMLKKTGKKVCVCGNIGTSFSKCAVFDRPDIAVVEVSSFQLESIKTFYPSIAVITNIDCDHLDRHKDIYTYTKLKHKITLNQTKIDTLVLPMDGIRLSALKDFIPQSRVEFTSLSKTGRAIAYAYCGGLYYKDDYIISSKHTALSGLHNISNCLQAIAVAKQFNVSNMAIACVLSEFTGDGHRLEHVCSKAGIKFYNDSKGTNVYACISATKSVTGSTALILGGYDKGYEYDDLFLSMSKSVKKIVCIGAVAKKIYDTALKHGFKNIVIKKTLYEAVYECANSNCKNVLLSPATSSFDMFRDYIHRGETFVKIVKEL